jgi:hypothetical protein
MKSNDLPGMPAILLLSLSFSLCGCPSTNGNDPKNGGGPDLTAPAAPTNLIVSNVSSSSVRLAWTDNATNEKGFKIEQFSYMSGSTTLIDLPIPDSTTYLDTGLIVYAYAYKVRAYNDAGESPDSNRVALNVGNPIDAPTNLLATAEGPHAISLGWGQVSADFVNFSIERSSTSASTGFSSIGTSIVKSYTDTTCNAQTQYWYRVSQTSSQNVNSGLSNVATATTSAEITLYPPSGLNILASGSSVTISWTASPTPGVSYTVKRRQWGYSSGSTIATGLSTTSYSDSTANVGVLFYYSVAATLSSETSTYTDESSGGIVYRYDEVENNGPISWAAGADWYYCGRSDLIGLGLFEIAGNYSGSYAILNPNMGKNYDYDVFKIMLSKGDSIRFTKNSGNLDYMSGMGVSLWWLDSTDQLGSRSFASGGETYTPLLNAGVTIKHAYIQVAIPSGISGSAYDFTFTITN